MKIVTILGTRPEIIRLSLVIRRLDQLCDHILVDTNQNYEFALSRLFYEEMKVRKPNYSLGAGGAGGAGGGFGKQIGDILTGTQEILTKEKPDALLILGDTNSGLSAIVAKRMRIPVFHMEAGNRCFDDRVPEEVNRRIIDHSSDVLMPYTYRSQQNLLREGLPLNRIHVIGNPIWEVIRAFEKEINESAALKNLGLKPEKYFLVTMHRAENVDDEKRLQSLVSTLQKLYQEYKMPIVCSLHPRTRDRMKSFGIVPSQDGVVFIDPVGFFDFIALEKKAFCVLSDSGTVQEECSLFKRPNVTIRDTTERQETIDCGSNILSGIGSDKILECVKVVTSGDSQWTPPEEYLKQNVSETTVKIVMGYLHRKL